MRFDNMGDSLTGFSPIVNARGPRSVESLWIQAGKSCPRVPNLWTDSDQLAPVAVRVDLATHRFSVHFPDGFGDRTGAWHRAVVN